MILNQLKKIIHYSLLACVVLSFSGCGFALRGSDSIAAGYSALVLDSDQPNGDLTRLLRRSLDVANISVESSSSNAPVLMIRNEQSTSRPVSINPRARAAQYEVRLSIDIALIQDETELLPTETLMVERSYFEDIANIAGNRDEVELITTEMRRDLVNQLLRRLQASAASL